MQSMDLKYLILYMDITVITDVLNSKRGVDTNFKVVTPAFVSNISKL